ncbi:PUB domain containing protein [Nitzschia inconspicua]|uniref:PUB domain containing protein n=1 Tax=Nitzschia inconspicua TaxID=303405 RepID=A0A9K3KGR2_9STRA|nr:PUB domain containing protein [Nitzschia inconspicua]
MGFLDGVFGGDNKPNNKKGDDNNNNNKKKDNNPLANAFARVANAGGGPKSFQGQGKSLGGSKPGEVITVTLSQPGPLGVRVERKSNTNASAIVNEVIPGSQAEAAGLQRGDILCFAGTNGQDEIMYDMFLQLAQSGQRPLHLEARRLTATTMASANAKPAAAASSGFQSADAEVRRQAMIAAAEAREKAHKNKTKTIKHVTKSTLEKQKQLDNNNNNNKDSSVHSQKHEPLSDAARIAAQAAKQDEAALAAQLGYNPYQTAKSTAGQARNATTTVHHGTINAAAAGNHLPTSSSSSSAAAAATAAALPVVAPPSEPTTAVEDDVIPNDVEEALATVLSSNNLSAISILTKLIVNATTKGQDADEDAAAKFRKVRLSNPKIKAAVVDVTGALDLMMSVGFQLLDDDGGESCLVFPPHYQEPTWLTTVLKRMEQ